MQSTLWKKEEVIEENPNPPAPQQPLVIEYTLTDVNNEHVKSSNIWSIEPTIDSNKRLFTLSGYYSRCTFDLDSNTCTDVETDESKFGFIFVMKRLARLDLVFTISKEVRVLIANRHVHTLTSQFKAV